MIDKTRQWYYIVSTVYSVHVRYTLHSIGLQTKQKRHSFNLQFSVQCKYETSNCFRWDDSLLHLLCIRRSSIWIISAVALFSFQFVSSCCSVSYNFIRIFTILPSFFLLFFQELIFFQPLLYCVYFIINVSLFHRLFLVFWFKHKRTY